MFKIAYHPNFKYPLPEGHRFPMEKYELLPRQLLYEGTCNKENFFKPGKPNLDAILAVHDSEYVNHLLNQTLDKRAARKIGYPFSELLVERELTIVQGTVESSEFALKYGVSGNVGGGTHHAYAGHGEGFCMLNDQAVAAKFLLNHYSESIQKILIVDLDVHQGNGTAAIFENDDSVFTFSMHGQKNYPFKKENSDLDIGLPTGTGDDEYLDKLYEILPNLIESVRPDFIFYVAGADILETDKLGHLNCTLQGSKERDRFVIQLCQDYNIPLQIGTGGGYSPEIRTIVEAHANTFRLAFDIFF